VHKRHPELVEGRAMGNGDLCSEPLYGSTELTMTLLLVHKDNEWALNKFYFIGTNNDVNKDILLVIS